MTPYAAGFPANHPPMRTFWGIPIISGGRIIGDLYLTDKETGEFTDEDEDILMTLAVQAAIAIEKARLHESLEEITVLKERERIAMDLHDGAIQSLYGVGLKLETCIEELQDEPPHIRHQLDSAVEELHRVTRKIRGYIFDLRPDELECKDLDECLSGLLRELSVNTLACTDQSIQDDGKGNPCRFLSREQTQQLFYVAREAMTNILKHARARSVRVEVSMEDGEFRLRIIDDGVGVAQAHESPDGQGLRDMRQRAEALGGWLMVRAGDRGGTIITVAVPIEVEL